MLTLLTGLFARKPDAVAIYPKVDGFIGHLIDHALPDGIPGADIPQPGPTVRTLAPDVAGYVLEVSLVAGSKMGIKDQHMLVAMAIAIVHRRVCDDEESARDRVAAALRSRPAANKFLDGDVPDAGPQPTRAAVIMTAGGAVGARIGRSLAEDPKAEPEPSGEERDLFSNLFVVRQRDLQRLT